MHHFQLGNGLTATLLAFQSRFDAFCSSEVNKQEFLQTSKTVFKLYIVAFSDNFVQKTQNWTVQ